MPYVKKEFFVKKPTPAYSFLMSEFNLSMKEAQRWVDRFRLYQNEQNISEKNHKLFGKVEVVVYEPNPKGLKPCFYEDEFVVYEKPSGVLVHPTSRKCDYSLKDEILHEFGKDAHVVHRLDRETSGLILVAKNKKCEAGLKRLFERREVKKEYIALVRGQVEKPLHVNAPLMNNQDYKDLKIRMVVDKRGKSAITDIYPLFYFEDMNTTLVKVLPTTGRQHQIRVHLFHVKHPIIGDPIYGVSSEISSAYLDETLSQKDKIELLGATRLLLHASKLEFRYKEQFYSFESQTDIKKEFLSLAKIKIEEN